MITFIPCRVSDINKSEAQNLICRLFKELEQPPSLGLYETAGTIQHIVTPKYDEATSVLTFRILIRRLRTLDNYNSVSQILSCYLETLTENMHFEIVLPDSTRTRLSPQLLTNVLRFYTAKLCHRRASARTNSVYSFNELTATCEPLTGKQPEDVYNWLDEINADTLESFGIPLSWDELSRRNAQLSYLFCRNRTGDECFYSLTQNVLPQSLSYTEHLNCHSIKDLSTPEFQMPEDLNSVPDHSLHCRIALKAYQYSTIIQSICYACDRDVIPLYKNTPLRFLQPPARLCLQLKSVGWCCNNSYVVSGKLTPRDAALLNEVAIGGCIIVICSDDSMTQCLNTLASSLQFDLISVVFLTNVYHYDQIVTTFNVSDPISIYECYNLNNIEQQKLIGARELPSGLDSGKSLVSKTIDSINNQPLSISELLRLREKIDREKDTDIALLYYRLLDRVNSRNKLNADEVKALDLICAGYGIPRTPPLERLEAEIGQKFLKEKLTQRLMTYIHQVARNCDPPFNFNLALVGNHGCGKTYYSIVIAGILSGVPTQLRKPNDSYTIVPAHRFYSGNSRTTIRALEEFFIENTGNTIIIEELSNLLRLDEPGIETIKDIINSINEFGKDNVVIINDSEEGYSSVCAKIPYIESLIETIQLSNYSVSELSQIYSKVIKEKFHYKSFNTSCAEKELIQCMRSISGEKKTSGALVGNARFVLQAAENTILAHNENLFKSATQDDCLSNADIHKGFSLTLSEFKRRKDSVQSDYKFNSVTDISFTDIIGNEAAKNSLKRFVQYIKNPAPYNKVNAKMPRGILLEGPPGTGKTILAKALAKEARIPFCYVAGSSFVEKYVGVGAERVRKLFKEARKREACIIFIDEIDALGPKRNAQDSSQETDRTLNQLLTEMDGFDSNLHNIFVLAATNRVSMLDSALTRAGRFDEIINVGLPNGSDRTQMFNKFLGNSANISDAELQNLSDITCGCSGATIHGIVKNAALLAGDKGLDKITYAELSASLTNALVGHATSISMTAEEKERVSRHEIGHALLTYMLQGTGSISKVTIIPHSDGSAGFSWGPRKECVVETRADLLNRLDIFMGGYAAEKIFYTDISTGVCKDLEQASDLAYKMVTMFGMYPEIEFCATTGKCNSISAEYKETVSLILRDSVERAVKKLKDNIELFNKLVTRLIKDEEIDGSVFEQIVQEV